MQQRQTRAFGHVTSEENLRGWSWFRKIDLRVVDKVAAVVTNVTVDNGHKVTLECATTQGFLPLSYCRFEPPASTPFSINADINATK